MYAESFYNHNVRKASSVFYYVNYFLPLLARYVTLVAECSGLFPKLSNTQKRENVKIQYNPKQKLECISRWMSLRKSNAAYNVYHLGTIPVDLPSMCARVTRVT